MSVTISWSHSWSSSDDGTILWGADLQNIQTNIEAHTHTEDVETSGDQTVGGIKTFTGANVHSGSNTFSGELSLTGTVTFDNDIDIIKTTEYVFMAGDLVSWQDDAVWYR